MKTTLKGRVFTESEFQQLLQNDFVHSAEEDIGFWCVLTKPEERLIGIAGLLQCNYQNKPQIEFGFILHEHYWGQGLAKELGQFWLQYAREHMKLNELVATASPTNEASIRVLQKLDMVKVGEFVSQERGPRILFSKVLHG